MDARIAVLEGPIVDQIAAGEVVERPASVVKELVENALDAGARAIAVALEDGGRRTVVVRDDGCGMGPVDARRSIERHATSKLRAMDDFASLATLGFRGEALPSIASVSRMILETRPHDDDAGTRLVVEAGRVHEVTAVGMAPGTSVRVEGLFANVPARLKFLKSKATEAGAVYDVVLRAALAAPRVRFEVTHEGRRIHTYAAQKALAGRAAELFEDERLVPLEASAEGLRVEAHLAPPERARSGARALHVLVNARPVLDPKLARAVAFAFGSVLDKGKYPVGVVSITVPADEVDVNAHPQKAEVRFARGSDFYATLSKALARKLGTKAFGTVAPRPSDYWDVRLGAKLGAAADRASGVDRFLEAFASASGSKAEGPSEDASNPVRSEPAVGARRSPAPYGAEPGAHVSRIAASLGPRGTAPAGGFARPNPSAGTPPSSPDAVDVATHVTPMRASDVSRTPTLTPELDRQSLRFLHQLRRTYLLCESADGLVILDQHAASERVVYHRLVAGRRDGPLATQRLVFPERVDLAHEDVDRIEAEFVALERFGLELTRVGARTVAVHAVPALLRRAAPRDLVLDVVAELTREGERRFGDALDTALATMACHAAVRGGDAMGAPEAEALLTALAAVEEFGGHCPHGRPVLLSLTYAELARKLGR